MLHTTHLALSSLHRSCKVERWSDPNGEPGGVDSLLDPLAYVPAALDGVEEHAGAVLVRAELPYAAVAVLSVGSTPVKSANSSRDLGQRTEDAEIPTLVTRPLGSSLSRHHDRFILLNKSFF